MDFKKNIIRILLLALWIVLASSVLVLLGAAMNIKNHKLCKGIEIEIKGVKEIFFLDKADIMNILAEEGIVSPAGKAMTDFNLQRLEAVLKKNVWVKDAELFFDNNLVFHINILEKEPVARVFTNKGHTFYVDSSGNRMPLSNKMNVKLPVFTGFPEDKMKYEDSILINSIRKLTIYILNDKFWTAQIAQININADGNFEMIPTVGNHTIEFGDGNNYESKFKRLLIFYRQVLAKTGIDIYSKISVQYSRQVIGTKRGMITKVDSVQALKNIQNMIAEAKKNSEDSAYAPLEKNMPIAISSDSMIMMDSKIDSAAGTKKKTIKTNDSMVKPVLNKGRTLQPINKITAQPEKKMPKALMPKLSN